jgi:magnesium transporter
MDANLVDTALLQVRERLEQDDVAGALRLIEALMPADRADVFEELPLEQQQTLLPHLENEDAADILEELGDEEAAALAGSIDAYRLAPILDEMEPDEAADLLGDLEQSLSSATLEQMQDSDEVMPLLLHADQTAGGLMTSEYLAFPAAMRADQAIEAVRRWEPKGEESPYLFVVDAGGHLVGVASLFKVLRAVPEARLAALMDRDVVRAYVDDDQEAAARLMGRYDLVVMPVIDHEERLVGVITIDDLVDVLEEEATEDIQRISGSQPLDRPYLDSSIFSVVWKRIGWLLLLFVTGTLTGTVMRIYQDQLAAVVVLSVFIPLLVGTGGNAGSQTTATIIRALAVGDIALKDSLRVLWHELRTAIILGLMLSAVAYVRAITWGTTPLVAAVVSLSIIAIVIWADSVGSMLPLLAARLKMDPALVSGPLMSTLVDATGLLIYFTIAGALLQI